MIPGGLNVAVLGAGGHLGRSMCNCITEMTDWQTFAFTRNPAALGKAFSEVKRRASINIHDIDQFQGGAFDIVLNCVGLGDAGLIADAGAGLMQLTEEFDDIILKYLAANPQSLYVSFSSGAIYGTDLPHPIEPGQRAIIDLASASKAIGYTVAKLNSEVKHRLNSASNIVDIRLYGFFSRFQPKQGQYLMSDVIASLSEGTVLTTQPDDMMRDYIHPDDLLRMIACCFQTRPLNTAIDAYSCAPTGKFELLDHLKAEFGLNYKTLKPKDDTESGGRPNYYSLDRSADKIGYEPRFSSIAGVANELKAYFEHGCGG